jgi:MoaA/NifB/PqqE/SkfB family radical SAM enzyme
MQPRTNTLIDPKSLNRLLRTVGGMSRGSRQPGYVAPIPLDIGVELTNWCNLRCEHCFLWNGDGLYTLSEPHRRKIELEWAVLDKVLSESRPARSNLFFWGTEPLLYSRWDKLSDRLEEDPRWTTICTNGSLVERRLDSLLKISENMAIVLSIDGERAEHDALRGQGNFDDLLRTLELLKGLQARGEYRGLISLHCVLHEPLIPKLFDFSVFCEGLGVDSLYVGFPWFINQEVAARMDTFLAERLDFLDARPADKLWSWHTYQHHLPETVLPELREQMRRIRSRVWNMRFRFQPAIEDDELADFIAGTERPAQRRTQCLSVKNRLDVRCTGKVTSCQPYPDLAVGDLNHQGLLEVWHGMKFGRVRDVVQDGLMPICSKCILLYLNGRSMPGQP